MRTRRRTSILIVALAVLAALPSAASADGVYQTQHYELSSVDGAPLRSGFVQNIHANGPVVYANERYHVNGAAPHTTLAVTLLLYPFDTGCAGEPVAIPTAEFDTNAAGNGHAEARFEPAAAEGLAGEHGVAWTVSAGGEVLYETGCQLVTLD